MRGVYIRKARFQQIRVELHDRFLVRGRHGHKIEDAADQQELRLTATFIKQFTQFLTWAPDPAKALDHFDRFLDQLLEGGRTGRALDFLKEQKSWLHWPDCSARVTFCGRIFFGGSTPTCCRSWRPINIYRSSAPRPTWSASCANGFPRYVTTSNGAGRSINTKMRRCFAST